MHINCQMNKKFIIDGCIKILLHSKNYTKCPRGRNLTVIAVLFCCAVGQASSINNLGEYGLFRLLTLWFVVVFYSIKSYHQYHLNYCSPEFPAYPVSGSSVFSLLSFSKLEFQKKWSLLTPASAFICLQTWNPQRKELVSFFGAFHLWFQSNLCFQTWNGFHFWLHMTCPQLVSFLFLFYQSFFNWRWL